MRALLGSAAFGLVVVSLAGCPSSGDDGYGYYNPGDPSSVPGCQADSDCSGSQECARDGECLPAAEIRAIKVMWTVRGQPASDDTCVDSPDLELSFDDGIEQDEFGFAPVPCNAGQFPIDKMPSRYVQADLGILNTSRDQSAPIDSTGLAQIDLEP
jgi:hypothetical protein